MLWATGRLATSRGSIESEEGLVGARGKGVILGCGYLWTTHLHQPVQRFAEKGPAHGALGQGQGGGPVPAQRPAEGPEVLSQAEQQAGAEESAAHSPQHRQAA